MIVSRQEIVPFPEASGEVRTSVGRRRKAAEPQCRGGCTNTDPTAGLYGFPALLLKHIQSG